MTWLPLHYWLLAAGAGLLVFAAWLLGRGLVAIARHQQATTSCRPLALPWHQPDLIGEVPQRRRPTPQANNIYAAIVTLRKAGHRVEPRGEHSHAIDGEQVDQRELLWRARAVGPQ